MPLHGLSYRHALILLGVVVVAWGTNWPVTKTLVREMSPLWSTALRCGIAAVVLAMLLWLRGEFIIPKRGDVPVVLSTSLLHMTAYSALIATGLQFLPAGRAIVLGYTTPIWVTLGARIFLSEAITTRRAIGVCLGLAGLAVIFSPGSFNWSDRNSLVGSGLILLAAVCWAANIVYVMSHISTNFDRSGFQQDHNVVLPIDRLNELATDGTVGSVASVHYSFMGATHPAKLERTAKQLAGLLKQDRVDLVLLVPV